MEVARFILERFIGAGLSPETLLAFLETQVQKVAGKMEAKGITPRTTARAVIVRDALFRLIRTVVPSGDIADLLRDIYDDRVVARVTATQAPEATLPALVRATAQALVEVVF